MRKNFAKFYFLSVLFFVVLFFNSHNVFASISNLETFDVITDLTTKFYDDGSPAFTNIATSGIGNSGSVNVPASSNDIWTTKKGYSVSGTGDKYVFSGFFEIAANSGYGQVGFTPDISNTGDFSGAPLHGLGFYFHGGGGGFINNRAYSNVFWSPDLTYSPATWYYIKYEVTAIGSNKYDQHFEIWNTNGTGATTTIKVQGNLNGVTNADIGSSSILHGYFSAAGSRMDRIDNFQVELSGNATFVEEGAPIIVGDSVTSVTTSDAVSGGNVLSDQGNAISDNGICYVAGTTVPTLADSCTSMGASVGSFSGTFTGLAPLTTYTVRAYATNSSGTSYGTPQTFTTAYSLIKVGGNSFTVTETGVDTDSMDIVLTAAPGSNVILNISSGSTTAGTISPSTLTFTPADWMNPQTVTLTAVDNNVLDNAKIYFVTVAVDPSSDAAYVGVPAIDVPATTLDDGDIFVEFSAATSSDLEATGANFVKLLINAILSSSVTVDLVNLLTGSASSTADYSFTSPQTITIPAGTYDGTLNTALSISGLTVIDNSTYEATKTIDFVLQNATGLKIGDANGDATSQITWTYSISNDDTAPVSTSTPVISGGGGGSTPYSDAYVDAGMVGGANDETVNGTKLNNELVLKNVTDPETLTPDGHSNIDLQTCKPSFPLRAKYNSKNNAKKIRELQIFLNTQKIVSEDLPITGLFHRSDVDAVKKFQRENGLKETGEWGATEHDIASEISCGWVSPEKEKKNKQKIDDKLNKKSTTTATTTASTTSIFQRVVCEEIFKKRLQIDKPTNDPKSVKTLQKFLNQELGESPDQTLPVNGLFGPLTEKYVKKFQEKYFADIIAPQGESEPTGIWGMFSIRKANQILCGK